jgi:hypothetical protein
MGTLKSLFGELRWTPPEWFRRIGGRRFLMGLGVAFLLAVVVGGAWLFYQSLPKPARVVAEVSSPGITPIVDDEPNRLFGSARSPNARTHGGLRCTY